VIADRQGEAVLAPLEPARRSIGGSLPTARDRRCVAAKGIANTVNRADPRRRAAILSERGANLADEIREVRVYDERAGPEPLLQDGFRKDPGALRHESRQQIERLRRKVNLPAVANQLPRLEIDDEGSESNPHAKILTGSCLCAIVGWTERRQRFRGVMT
jgi:hypothetical protein